MSGVVRWAAENALVVVLLTLSIVLGGAFAVVVELAASVRPAALPEPPLDGIDANWATEVEKARAALKVEQLAFCALRAEAFELVARLGGPAAR